MKRDVLFFDFFGVVCSEIAPVWLKKYYDKKTAIQIKADIFPLADIGEIDFDEAMRKLSAATGISADRIKAEWQELIVINQDTVGLISSLRKSNDIYLLSNAMAPFLNDILYKNNLCSLFRKIFISSEIGLIKPNKDYFEYALNDLGLNAVDVIMIDDNAENIKGAESVGIKGIVFTSAENLKKELTKLGVMHS